MMEQMKTMVQLSLFCGSTLMGASFKFDLFALFVQQYVFEYNDRGVESMRGGTSP